MDPDDESSTTAPFSPLHIAAGSPEAYRLIAEHATDVILLSDLRGAYTWASPSMHELLGWNVEDVVGRSFVEFVHPDDVHTIVEARRSAPGGARDVAPVRYRRADGTYVWVEATARWVTDAKGSNVARVVSVRDVDQREQSRRELARAERLFRLIAENSSDVVFEADAEGMITWVSPSMHRRLGWRPDELVGSFLRDLIVETDRPVAHALRHPDTARTRAVDVRMKTSTGDTRWTSIEVHQTPGSDGGPANYVGTLRDRQAEVVLRRAVDTLSAATAAMIRAEREEELLTEMCQVAVDNGGYVFAWYGRRVDDPERSVQAVASSREHADYVRSISVSWGDTPLGLGPTGTCLREGRIMAVADFLSDPRYGPWRDAATSRGFRSSLSLPVFVDGVLDGAFMVYAAERDAFDGPATSQLTDLANQLGYGLRRLRDELALGERVKELRLLHRATQLLSGSRAVDRHLLAELVGLVPPAFMFPEGCSARIVHGDLVVATPGWRPSPWVLSAEFATSSGPGCVEVAYADEHPAAALGPFLVEEQDLIDSLAEMLRARIEEDVALEQRRALEEQLWQAQKLDALGTLAGGIAHDFNNILAAIGGNAELAIADLDRDHPARAALSEILKGHHRARDLVRRILVFSRQREPERRVVAFAPIVDEALDLLRASLPARVRIVTRHDPGIPDVFADATQIHQIVMNLGTNAAKAMTASGGVLSVRTDAVSIDDDQGDIRLAPGSWVRLTVTDTGIGMSPEVLGRVFEPFFTTDRHLGTGLGLAVVDGIVRAHAGVVTVNSAPGVGTEFAVYLPAASTAAVAVDPAAGGRRTGAGEHLMYVDDEQALVTLMTKLLERLGYRCSGFVDADVAVRAFRDDPGRFDAVVTDLHMPTMTGLQLVEAVRAVRPDVPVALTSGHTFGDAEPGLDGITWIRKPSTLDELADAIGAMLHPPAGPGSGG